MKGRIKVDFDEPKKEILTDKVIIQSIINTTAHIDFVYMKITSNNRLFLHCRKKQNTCSKINLATVLNAFQKKVEKLQRSLSLCTAFFQIRFYETSKDTENVLRDSLNANLLRIP